MVPTLYPGGRLLAGHPAMVDVAWPFCRSSSAANLRANLWANLWANLRGMSPMRRSWSPRRAPHSDGQALALTIEWRRALDAPWISAPATDPSERFPYTCGSPTTPISAGVSYISG